MRQVITDLPCEQRSLRIGIYGIKFPVLPSPSLPLHPPCPSPSPTSYPLPIPSPPSLPSPLVLPSPYPSLPPFSPSPPLSLSPSPSLPPSLVFDDVYLISRSRVTATRAST